MKNVTKQGFCIVLVLLLAFCLLFSGCRQEEHNGQAEDFAVMFVNAGRCDALIVRVDEKALKQESENNPI